MATHSTHPSFVNGMELVIVFRLVPQGDQKSLLSLSLFHILVFSLSLHLLSAYPFYLQILFYFQIRLPLSFYFFSLLTFLSSFCVINTHSLSLSSYLTVSIFLYSFLSYCHFLSLWHVHASNSQNFSLTFSLIFTLSFSLRSIFFSCACFLALCHPFVSSSLFLFSSLSLFHLLKKLFSLAVLHF